MGRFEQIIEARQKLCEATPGTNMPPVTNTPPVTPHVQPVVNSAPNMTAADIAAFEAGQPNQNKAIDDYLRTQTPGQIAQIKASLAAVANRTGANTAQPQPGGTAAGGAVATGTAATGGTAVAGTAPQQPAQQQMAADPYQTGTNMATADAEEQRRRQAAQTQPQTA